MLSLFRNFLSNGRGLACAGLAWLAFGFPAAADDKPAWWNEQWTVRKKINVDTSAAGVPESPGTAPVLLRLHDGNFQTALSNGDGGDIRFIADDGKTEIPGHVEKWDGVMNEALVWLRPADLKAGGPTSLWMYFGNPSAAAKPDDTKATFDGNDVLVMHFASQPATDSSGNNNNATGAGAGVAEGAMIGNGLRVDGKTPVVIPASASLAWQAGGATTVSLWVKPSLLKPGAVLLSRREGGNSFLLGIDNGLPFVILNASNVRSAAPVAVNSWRHIAVTAGNGQVTLFVDGEVAGNAVAPLPALNSDLRIGADGGDDGMVGEVDELVIAKVARPPGYVKFLVGSQGTEKGAKVVTLNPDEQGGAADGGHSGYMKIIINSLTLDGWIVIGLLGIMAVLSWYVMVTKTSYLNGIAKGNATFLKEWEHVASDLTSLDDPDTENVKNLGGRVNKSMARKLRGSSVFRIYHIGVEEIRHRLQADSREGKKGLGARSIQAIRAALDGGLVRETQKINKLIVLLTICISGGPFLGLLGTVVGVMITFAAVAAAGDVNVNAIAPGIAAALLATVAGLAVAIPSLFGYNYILSRVKDAKDDMHIFIDEFVAKLAEAYPDEA